MTAHFNVKVLTRAKKASVEKLGPDEFRIRVVSIPEKGKANKEVLKLLAGYLEVSPSCLTIVRGASSHHKVIKLES